MKLFQHQKEMVAATKQSSRGIIQAPTGTGKTFVQAGIVSEEIKQGGFRVILVKTPRILLTNQVCKEYTDFLNSTVPDTEVATLLVHSGKGIDDIFEEEEDSKLSEQEVEAYLENQTLYADAAASPIEITKGVQEAIELNIPFIIYTTYHSTGKVLDTLDRLDVVPTLCMNDEAHYLVRDDHSKIFNMTRPIREYFFTATVKETRSNDGKGMNNVDRFGKMLYSMSVKTAIDQGLILRIVPQVLRTNTQNVTEEEVSKSAPELIFEAFTDLESKYPGLGSKLLVSSNGDKHIRSIIASEELKSLIESGVEILTVHSTEDLITHNGNQIKREEFDKLKVIFGNDPNKRLIIVHFDILSEGIDVPGLLGVLILRNLKESKFLQTVGRVVRLYRPNPSLKEYGTLYFPDIDNADLRANFVQILTYIKRNDYLSKELFEEYSIFGSGEEEEVTQLEREFNRQELEDDIDIFVDNLPELEFSYEL